MNFPRVCCGGGGGGAGDGITEQQVRDIIIGMNSNLLHNNLGGLQGGAPGNYWHLDESLFVLFNSPGFYEMLSTLPDTLHDLRTMLFSAVLQLLNGYIMLPPVQDVADLPDTCMDGQVIYVRIVGRFYRCNNGIWEPATPRVAGVIIDAGTYTFNGIEDVDGFNGITFPLSLIAISPMVIDEV